MIEAIIFDFDGTIVDTEQLAYQTWLDVFTEHGVDLPLDVWLDCVGGGTPFDPVAYLQQQLGKTINRATIERARDAIFIEQANVAPLRAGVEAFIHEAKALGLRIGVASSSKRHWVQSHLERRGLLELFEVIKTRDDVKRVKPDPELYASAMADLGLKPSRGVAIEDSRNGLIAAKAAGMYCVVSPCSITRGLDFNEADLVLESLSDTDVASVIFALRGTALGAAT